MKPTCHPQGDTTGDETTRVRLIAVVSPKAEARSGELDGGDHVLQLLVDDGLHVAMEVDLGVETRGCVRQAVEDVAHDEV